jgi:methylenetetrahydrofolate reductase (NADPH)
VSRLEDAINAGRFVVTAELLTVNAGGLDAVHERFAPFEDYVDATNATDNTAAHAHASPLAVAIALKQLGMEPVMQLTCRDRNRLGLEAEIAGAALHGVENICCLTGDDVTAGDEPEARRVFDLDSIQLLALGSSMTQGVYLSGRKIEPAPKLFLGAVENPGAPPYDYRVERAWKKVHAGARFLQLQVSYEPQRLSAFMHEAVEKGLATACALIPSICLVRSPSALRYMDENVPGITLPAETIERRRVRARGACPRAARRRGPAPDQLSQGGRHRPSLPAPEHPDPSRKGDEWIPSSSRGLRPSSSVRSSRSASSASGSTPPAARHSRLSSRQAISRSSRPTSHSRSRAAPTCST